MSIRGLLRTSILVLTLTVMGCSNTGMNSGTNSAGPPDVVGWVEEQEIHFVKGSYQWNQAIADAPTPDELIRDSEVYVIDANAELTLEFKGEAPEQFEAGLWDNSNFTPLPREGDAFRLPSTPGQYVLSVNGEWTGDDSGSYAAAIEVKEDASTAVYHQFEDHISSSLEQARSYLLEHIEEAGIEHATSMTLQLEDVQLEQLEAFSEKLYPQKLQEAIDAAMSAKEYNRADLTYTYLLSVIDDPDLRPVIVESEAKGYKIETSEGMYYPVMDYEGFKPFTPYIHKDIAEYIEIMATESNSPSMFDAAIVISWDELIARTLEKEAFLKEYPNSSRASNIRNNLYIGRWLYGSSNTPAYGYDGATNIDPELRNAYEKAVAQGTGESAILEMLSELLELLDQSNNEFTPAIEKFIEKQLNLYNQ